MSAPRRSQRLYLKQLETQFLNVCVSSPEKTFDSRPHPKRKLEKDRYSGSEEYLKPDPDIYSRPNRKCRRLVVEVSDDSSSDHSWTTATTETFVNTPAKDISYTDDATDAVRSVPPFYRLYGQKNNVRSLFVGFDGKKDPKKQYKKNLPQDLFRARPRQEYKTFGNRVRSSCYAKDNERVLCRNFEKADVRFSRKKDQMYLTVHVVPLMEWSYRSVHLTVNFDGNQ